MRKSFCVCKLCEKSSVLLFVLHRPSPDWGRSPAVQDVIAGTCGGVAVVLVGQVTPPGVPRPSSPQPARDEMPPSPCPMSGTPLTP